MNAKFQAMYDQGMFAGVLDLRGTVIDANRSCLEQCGYTRDDVIGKPFWECGWWNPSPALRDWIRAGFAAAAGGEAFRGESPYYCADGTERVVEFAMMPIKDEAGRVLFVLPTGMDVTERRRAEHDRRAAEVLRESEAQFRLIADAMPQIVWVARPDGRHEYYNRRAHEYLGDEYLGDEYLGRGIGRDGEEGWAGALHPDDRGARRLRWRHALDTGEEFECEYRLRRRDGAYRWFLGRAAPSATAAGGW